MKVWQASEPTGNEGAGPPTARAGLVEIARGGALNLGGAAIFAVASVGVTVIITREFSRSVAGAFFIATSLFLIVEVVAGLGAYNGIIYFTARLRSLQAESRIPIIFRAAIVPVIVSSLAATAVLVVLAGPLARSLLGGHVFRGGASPTAVADALRALAATLPFAALLDTFLGASRGYRDMLPTVAVDRVGRSCLQILGVLVAALTGSAALLAPLWSLPYIPAAAIAWIWLRRIRRQQAAGVRTEPGAPQSVMPQEAIASGPPHQLSDRRLDNANPRGFWMFTAPRSLATVAQMLIQRLDIVLVGILRGPVEAAVYTAATRFLVVGQLANSAIGMAAQPQFSHLFARNDRRSANAVYQATTAWLIVLTWPLYLLAVIYGPEVLAVFGHSYRAGSTVMVILGLTMLVGTACGQVDLVLTTTGRSSWSLVNGLIAVSVNVAVDLTLIPRYGITGAAIGWAAAIVVSNLMPLVQVAWVVRVHPFGAATLAACTLTALSFCVIPVVVRALFGTGDPASILGVIAGCGALAAGLWACREILQLSILPGLSGLGKRSGGWAVQRGRANELASRESIHEDRRTYLSLISGLLWPPPSRVTLTRRGRYAVEVTPSGVDGPGPAPIPRELIVLPGRLRHRRLLVPLERRAAAAAVLRSGEPASRIAWLGTRAISLAMVSGAGPSLFRDRLRIETVGGSPSIESYLRTALGGEICVSMSLSPARANRKPVLQLLTARGEAIGFAKISIDPLTSALVRAEHHALVHLAGEQLTRLRAPSVLHFGIWNDLDVLVLGALPVWRRRRSLAASTLSAAMQEVAGLTTAVREPVTTSAHWLELVGRLGGADRGADRTALLSALDQLADRADGAVLAYGSWHGDWTPWNMASTRDGLLVWDWERFREGVPIGFDSLHYWLQTAVVPDRREPASAARDCIERSVALLAPFGVERNEARLTALLYLADLSVRYVADHQADTGRSLGASGTWLIPAIINELDGR